MSTDATTTAVHCRGDIITGARRVQQPRATIRSFIMLGVSSLLVFLQRGASEIASQFDLNDFVSEMIKGMILFFILGSEFFINFKVHFRTARKETENK